MAKDKNGNSAIPDNRMHAKGVGQQQRILWAAMFAQGIGGRRGLPYVLVGQPGSAKTSVLKQLSKKAGLPFEGVLGSLRSPVDFNGVPVPQRRKLTAADQHLDPDGGSEFLYMHYAPAGFAVRSAAAAGGRSMVLFDEVNTCPPSVQAALLRVLFEGVVGEMELPPGVRMMLAMNETKDAAGGWDIAPPLANRMGWLDWQAPDVQGFTQYILTGGKMDMDGDAIDPITEEKAVDARWDSAWAKASGEITGFLHRIPSKLLEMPKMGKGSSRQWPSPRTWEFAIRAHTASYVYDLTELERAQAVSAYVGTGAYSEFFQWRKDNDLPDPELLLDGGTTFKHNPARLDRTAAVLTSCTGLVTPENAPKRKERNERLWTLLKDMTDTAADVCLPSVVALCQSRLMLGCTPAYKVLAALEPVMSAAGLSRVS